MGFPLIPILDPQMIMGTAEMFVCKRGASILACLHEFLALDLPSP